MAFQSKDSLVLGVQLKVQRLVVKSTDPCVSVSGNNITIDVKEPIKEVRLAMFMQDAGGAGAGALTPLNASKQTISGTQVTLNLGAAIAAADCVAIDYVLDPTQS